MNKFILPLCFISFWFSKTAAQVAAGVTDNLIIGQESVHLAVFAPNSFDYDLRRDSLDFDGDGQYDALFTAEAAWVPDYVGGFTGIQALHPGFALMLNGDYTRALAAGDSINAAQTWSDPAIQDLYSAPFVTRFWGFSGQLQEYGNWIPPNSTAFVGFRIVSAQGIRYGWFRVTASANPNFPSAGLTVNGLWAIEIQASSSQPSDFVIAGKTSDLIAGNQPIVLQQDSISFGGTMGKIDSLDLDDDGRFDAAFTVSICNTFDCQLSRTHCVGMHDGFTFVQGSVDARRFEENDTIGANANWNTAPGPYRFARLAESGIGFNGFQTGGEWLNQNFGYLGFRLVTPASDTLLGWIYIHTYSLNENGAYLEVLGWAIQSGTSMTPPSVLLKKIPEKAVYCPGDAVIFKAATVGADQIVWHFWDGTSDSAALVTKILPDSAVTVTFEATNENGTTTATLVLEVSPLLLTVSEDIVLDCAHPSGTLTAGTNIPAEICWFVGPDTICGTTPPVVSSPVPVVVIAQDEYGCTAAGQIGISMDVAPPGVSIEYDEENNWLIANSATPGVAFEWIWSGGPVTNDSVFVTQSGTYAVIATAQNGCTSTAKIDVVFTSAGEPLSEQVRIQPNPASDFLQIENRLASDFYFKIFDAAGALEPETGTVPANSAYRHDLKFLPGGLYLLTGYDPHGKPLFFRKFVKR